MTRGTMKTLFLDAHFLYRMKYLTVTIITFSLLISSFALALPVLASAANPSFTPLHTYYMSPTRNDINAGTSPGAPWATPNHNIACGDVIVAASGAYTGGSDFGQPTGCPSTSGGIDGAGGIYMAVLLCGGASVGDCTLTGAMDVATNYWAIEGWSTTNPGGFCYLMDATASGTTRTHHVAFINDIAHDCDDEFYYRRRGA